MYREDLHPAPIAASRSGAPTEPHRRRCGNLPAVSVRRRRGGAGPSKVTVHRQIAPRLVCRLANTLLTAAVLVMNGCSRERPVATPALRIGILPDLDSLPMLVADAEGFFAAANLRVELVRAASAAERDQLLQAERLDGVVTDPVALVLYDAGGLPVTAVRHSMVPMPGRPQFRLMAAPGSDLRTAQQLRGVPIATSEGTVAEYTACRALEAAGLAPGEIKMIAVPALAVRLTLLAEGKVAAAIVPEPFATQAALAGSTALGDEIDHRPFCCSLIAFRNRVLAERRAEVERFALALDRAADIINTDKPRAMHRAIKAQILPKSCAESMVLMDYPVGTVPDRALIDGVVRWLRERGRLTRSPAYDNIVRPILPAQAAAAP